LRMGTRFPSIPIVMKVTIRDVAKAAGVSPSTVSRALNGKGRMRPETRERILRIARELGFRPNPLAKGLATKMNYCIGVGIDARHLPIKRSFYGAVLEAIEEVLDREGYHLVFSVIRNAEAPRCVIEGRVDGVILMGTDVRGELVEKLREKLPLVLVDYHLPGAAAVVTDNFGGAKAAVEHLIGHGHRKIAFVVETLSDPNFKERFEGYRAALEAHGILFDEKLVFEGGRRAESSRFAMEKFFETREMPTAIFGANDHMAIGAIRALKEAGIRVPEDVAVAGFDDGDLAPHVTPPLTSVHVPRGEMGRRAAVLLLDLLRGKLCTVKTDILSITLTIRSSCGCGST